MSCFYFADRSILFIAAKAEPSEHKISVKPFLKEIPALNFIFIVPGTAVSVVVAVPLILDSRDPYHNPRDILADMLQSI